MKLSEYIRSLRKRKELSQQDLADQIGVSKGYISRLESEKTYGRSKKHVPSISILNSLARAGGETLNDLLEQIACGEPIYAEQSYEGYIESGSPVDAESTPAVSTIADIKKDS